MGLFDAIPNASAALGSAGITGASNFATGLASAGLGYMFNKKLMSQQNQYNIEAFKRQLEAVKQMPTLQKEGLKAAGYSTADPSGTGFTQLSPSQQGVSLPSQSVDLGSGFDLTGAQGALANAELARAQADLVSKQSKRYNELTDAQILGLQKKAFHDQMAGDLSNAEATQIDTLLPVLRDKGFTEIAKIRSETRILDKNIDLISEQINKTIQETKTSKAAESAAYASAEASRASAQEARQNVEESKSRVDINIEEKEKRHQEALSAKQDAIWKSLEIEFLKHGVDINAPMMKKRYQMVVGELLDCKDENAVKRVLKQTFGGILGATDYLLDNASGIVSGAIGYGLGSRGKR